MKVFRDAIGSSWFQKFFPSDLKSQLTDFASRIYQALISRIQEVSWLDQYSKARALNKASLITQNIIYESYWDDAQDGLLITGDFGYDLLSAGSYFYQRLLRQSDLPLDFKNPDYHATPWSGNAFYSAQLNSINIIPGLVLAPLFDTNATQWLNVASFGFVVGHELIHGFDSNGKNYDPWGENIPDYLFSGPAELVFNNQSSCLIDQYNQALYKGFYVDGTNTLAENIADAGGISLSWIAYKLLKASGSVLDVNSQFSTDQLFWIRAAQDWCESPTVDDYHVAYSLYFDEHAPSPIRAVEPFRNHPGFAQSF